MLPPVIKTTRFTLKPYERHDEDAFIEICLDKEAQRFMNGGLTRDESEERSLFRKIFDIYADHGKRWCWIWGIYEDNKLCGHFELKETEHTAADELEIVYMVHPAERRRGVMSEVLHTIKNKQPGWNKAIIATTSLDNDVSIALLHKWGVEKQEIITAPDTLEQYYKFCLRRY
ncbi:GNAT family N-acetyltransferase [Chitinophaga japonensis]|uniref:RimJ/RimL family protein N-acetyltransferase n=1 Tax=Chitinophaga japonensis TaxID=104662 RepID=A0A562SMX0_CHIJA|nr:GNAT family N-acetyltransferase [Chitinophaga japonensis]TWI82558.1 RimJ/RimL family protein N-acetyltransferase [Chitinophaga japonensis]